ncbi:hypothetical protein POM88_033021 [Heracleum sosnowskyi]|uniref:Uncharacterized protein n=1 Tax=Heracleum sosnowskyi TaxID=360622 RepID=A0AAD8I2T1_9APIA|nr:hypothetical protein POM88_033021 [Heracleum sosnowskyi]
MDKLVNFFKAVVDIMGEWLTSMFQRFGGDKKEEIVYDKITMMDEIQKAVFYNRSLSQQFHNPPSNQVRKRRCQRCRSCRHETSRDPSGFKKLVNKLLKPLKKIKVQTRNSSTPALCCIPF